LDVLEAAIERGQLGHGLVESRIRVGRRGHRR
jgi:hypothetical protein